MTAISTDTFRGEALDVHESGLPVKDDEVIPAGALVCVDTSGRAVNGATTAGLRCAGVARVGIDNTDGGDGVLTDYAEARTIEVQYGKAWSFTCNGSPAIGKAVWLVDNNTVTTVAGNVPVGTIVQHDARSANWMVHVPGLRGSLGVLGAQIAALTDNTAGAANTTLQAIPDPADTPGTADALRDDIVANDLPAIRNNFADLAAAINALRGV